MAKNTQYPNLITGRIGDAKSPRVADTTGSAAHDHTEVNMHKDSTRQELVCDRLKEIEQRLDREAARLIPTIIARECGMRSRAFKLATIMVDRFMEEGS